MSNRPAPSCCPAGGGFRGAAGCGPNGSSPRSSPCGCGVPRCRLAIPLLHRFVILNAATIATNLAPFTGLDGAWILADTVARPRPGPPFPRLGQQTPDRPPAAARRRRRPRPRRVRHPQRPGRRRAARHRRVLLVPAVRRPRRHPHPPRPGGSLTLTGAAAILAMPALAATAPRLAQAAASARALHDAITFRLQWKWRIPATRHLAAAFPQIARLSQQELGLLAGHLHRTRARPLCQPRHQPRLRRRPRRHPDRYHRLRRPRHPRPRRHLGPQPPAAPRHPPCHPYPHPRHRPPPAPHPQPRPDMNTTRHDQRPQITAVLLEAA